MSYSCLAESLSGILYTKMPVIWLQPIVNRKRKSADFYSCPVYRTFARAGTATIATTGQSTSYVLTIEIPSKEEEKFWIKRGVCCSLND